MQSVHEQTVKRALEAARSEGRGPQTLDELKRRTSLRDEQVMRGIRPLRDSIPPQIVPTFKRVEIKAGHFRKQPAYELSDPDSNQRSVQEKLNRLDGFNTAIYMPQKLRDFLGVIPEKWDISDRHMHKAPEGLVKVSESLYKALRAFNDYIEEAAEEKVVANLSESDRRTYKEYVRSSEYLGFLDGRNRRSKREKPGRLSDSEILEMMKESIASGWKKWKGIPNRNAKREALKAFDAVMASPGEDISKKIKFFLLADSESLQSEKMGAFELYLSPSFPAPIESLPLTTWERGELRRLTRGMHIWDRVMTEKYAFLADVGEENVILTKYGKSLEQINLEVELGEKIDERLESARKGDGRALDPFTRFVKSLDRIADNANRNNLLEDGRFDGPKTSDEQFAEEISPLEGLLDALSLKGAFRSLSDEYSLEKLVLAKLQSGEKQLQPRERILVAKLWKLYSPALSKTPGQTILQRYPSYKRPRSVSDFLDEKENLELASKDFSALPERKYFSEGFKLGRPGRREAHMAEAEAFEREEDLDESTSETVSA